MAGENGSETQVALQPAPQTATIVEKHPVAESLRAELLSLARLGDPKNDGALTADVLARIVRVAKTGRDLLVSLNIGGNNLGSMVRRPKGGVNYFAMGGQDMADDDNLGESSQTAGGPFAYTSPQENFGMTAIRELMSLAKNFNGSNSPGKLVEALAIAREKGLTDVAKALEVQLGVGQPVAVAEAPKPADGKGGQP